MYKCANPLCGSCEFTGRFDVAQVWLIDEEGNQIEMVDSNTFSGPFIVTCNLCNSDAIWVDTECNTDKEYANDSDTDVLPFNSPFDITIE